MIRYYSPNYKHKAYPSFDEDITISFYGYREYLAVSIIVGYRYWEGRKWVIKKENEHGNLEPVKATHKFGIQNRECLQKALKKLRVRFRYEHEWAEFRKDAMKLVFTPREKSWEEVLPEKIVSWASSKLQHYKNAMQEHCVDNYRVARVGNTCQERRYKRQVEKGCCGFFDTIEICRHDGKAYKLGFNYGH